MSFRFGMLLAIVSAGPVAAREWQDVSGKISQEAELVDFDDQLVVLKKADGRLVALDRKQLSADDRKYLDSQDAKKEVKDQSSKEHTWTMVDGREITGRVVKYGRRELTIERRGGKLIVQQKPWKDLTEWYQFAVLKLVENAEGKPMKDEKAVESLIARNKGTPLQYTVEGVLLELEGGELLPAPFIMFSEKDLKILKPGWEAWSKADQDEKKRDEQSTLMRSLANEYQKTRDAEMKIQMLSAASEWFDLWEVGLTAPNGDTTTVVVPGRDSRSAQIAAQQKYPDAQVGPTRKLRRRG